VEFVFGRTVSGRRVYNRDFLLGVNGFALSYRFRVFPYKSEPQMETGQVVLVSNIGF
jgi:hypothetical protein